MMMQKLEDTPVLFQRTCKIMAEHVAKKTGEAELPPEHYLQQYLKTPIVEPHAVFETENDLLNDSRRPKEPLFRKLFDKSFRMGGSSVFGEICPFGNLCSKPDCQSLHPCGRGILCPDHRKKVSKCGQHAPFPSHDGKDSMLELADKVHRRCEAACRRGKRKFERIPISEDSFEFREVQRCICRTKIDRNERRFIKLCKLWRVVNTELEQEFHRRARETKQTNNPSVFAFHGTPLGTTVDKILESGFLLPDASNTPNFGQGIFTTISSSKACYYASGKKSVSDEGTLIIVEVKTGHFEPPPRGMNVLECI
eukprot:TRINITY_DN728_c0_g1_i3.p1 TRINITY_DN728_c0_g1~~TRINITY_DN728_c0_g1_i3.p1  ORF type:complete len:310 (-),score=49.45 TRINITY_DN728_c0_g1_i3:176-1105(-)